MQGAVERRVGYFFAVEPTELERRLADLDRTQLVELVQRLIASQPQLEDLVYLSLRGEDRGTDGVTVGLHAHRILIEMGRDREASLRAAVDLDPLVKLGKDYERAGAHADARAVYRSIIDEILGLYESLRDNESDLAHVVVECVEGLDRCLERTDDPGVRQQLLEDLFHVYRWDTIDHGGHGMSKTAKQALLTRTTETEQKALVVWLRDALPTDETSTDRWGRQNAGRFLLALLDDPHEIESVLYDARLVKEHAILLVRQGRRDEALALLPRAGNDLLVVADLLVEAGLTEQAVAGVLEHGNVLDANNRRTRAWLQARGVPMEGLEKLLWEITSFGMRVSIGRWKQLRSEATRLGWWPEVSEVLLQIVDNEKTNTQPIRARALAAAGRLTEAMEVFSRLPQSATTSAAVDIGRDAEQDQPALAIELYETAIARLRTRNTRAAREEVTALQQRIARLSQADGTPST